MTGPDRRASSRRWRIARRSLWVLAPLLMLAPFPELVERVYVPWIGRPLTRSLAVLTGIFPWSLAEWVEGFALVGLLVFLGRAAHRVRRGDDTPRQALVLASPPLIASGLWIVTVFYAAWGLNYARAPAYDRLGWESVQLDALEDPDELRGRSREGD